jgi:exonuclease SbcD
MKFLHTSDWHVGKSLKGRSRLDEQRAVLREIVDVARDHEVDAVLVAGDVYDSAAPTAEAQRVVVDALLALRQAAPEVIVIAGNHDHASTFDAYRPLMRVGGITIVGRARTAADGGVVEFTARSTGDPVTIAVLPFLSQRYAVRAAELVTQSPAKSAAGYDELVREVLRELTAGFRGDAVNIVMAHLTVTGGQFGGGERAAQSIFEYHVPAAAFPADAHYVALGHLHRRQTLPAAAPVVYCGAPLPVDFGEQDNTPVVCVVEAAPGVPARVTDVPITSGRRLRTVRGTVAELRAAASSYGEDYLRVWVREPSRAGLRDEIEEFLPNALEVRIDPEFAVAASSDARPSGGGLERTPRELFAEFLQLRGIADERLDTLFARLHDEVTTSGQVG